MELLIKTKTKENFADNQGHNIMRLFDTLPIFFSLKVERGLIISNEHGIYELPHELPNDLKLKILGNEERLEELQNLQN